MNFLKRCCWGLFLFIRSVIFTVVFDIYTLVLCTAFLPTLFLPFRYVYLLPKIWAKYTPALLKICGITVQIQGQEHLPKMGGYLVASKHQSALETVLLFNGVPNLIFVLKRSLLFLPIVGLYFLRLGFVAINRSGGGSTMRKMALCVNKQLDKGHNICIFPEGTRTKPKEKRPFNPGVAFLYAMANVPVVPVALNTGKVWPKNSLIKYPGEVIIRFLPAIPSGLEKRDFLHRLQETIETEQKILES